MIGHPRHRPTRSDEERDQGSALIMVLVVVALASLIVLPMLDYATAVGRQNTVLSTKTKRQEAVKAGLRTVLADPSKVFEYCAEGSPSLAGPGIDGIDVETTCNFIDFSLAELDEDLHLGLVATRVGETIPNSLEAIIQTDVNGDPLLDGAGNPVRFVYDAADERPRGVVRPSRSPRAEFGLGSSADLAAEPARALGQSAGCLRVRDARRLPGVSGLLPRHVSRPGRARRADLLRIGRVLLPEHGHRGGWC